MNMPYGDEGGMSRRAYQRALWKSTRGLPINERKRKYAQGMSGYGNGYGEVEAENTSQGDIGGVRWF
jgi:hypothetical protein